MRSRFEWERLSNLPDRIRTRLNPLIKSCVFPAHKVPIQRELFVATEPPKIRPLRHDIRNVIRRQRPNLSCFSDRCLFVRIPRKAPCTVKNGVCSHVKEDCQNVTEESCSPFVVEIRSCFAGRANRRQESRRGGSVGSNPGIALLLFSTARK